MNTERGFKKGDIDWKKIGTVACFGACAAFLGACATSEQLAENLKDKSIQANAAMYGGEIVTAVDPTTGAIMPALKFGKANMRIMNHKVGDGTQLEAELEGCWYSPAAISGMTAQVNAQGCIKSFSMVQTAGSTAAITYEDYEGVTTASSIDSAVSTDTASANAKIAKPKTTVKDAKEKIAEKISKLDKSALLDRKDKINTVYADVKKDSNFKSVLEKLMAASDSDLEKLNTANLNDQTKVILGTEIMRREVEKQLASR